MDLRRCLRDQPRHFTDRNLQAVPSKVVGHIHGLFRCHHERNRGQPALHDGWNASEGGDIGNCGVRPRLNTARP